MQADQQAVNKWERRLRAEGLPPEPSTVLASLSTGCPGTRAFRYERASTLAAMMDWLWRHEATLTRKEQDAIYEYAQEGRTIREVADKVRLSKSRVHRLMQRVRLAALLEPAPQEDEDVDR